MNRGRRKERIFFTQGDYETFVIVLKETAKMWNLKISAYCLMSNHYHLLVHTHDGNISRCMRHINGVYTQRFNIDEQTLLVSKRGEENLARDIVVYLVRHYSMETILNVGKYFDINNYSTVSSVVERVKRRKIKYPSLRNHLEKIEKKFNKSQKQT